jgi:hypothetical protein
MTQPGLGEGSPLTRHTIPGNLVVSCMDTPAERNRARAVWDPFVETHEVSIPLDPPPGTPVGSITTVTPEPGWQGAAWAGADQRPTPATRATAKETLWILILAITIGFSA